MGKPLFDDLGHLFYDFETWFTGAHPLQLISGPCSIEIMYPCEWRIAIPASLMQVEETLMELSVEQLSKAMVACPSKLHLDASAQELPFSTFSQMIVLGSRETVLKLGSSLLFGDTAL